MKVKPAEEIERFLQPIAKELSVELLEAKWEFKKSGASLTLVIDAEGGVDLNLCEAFHRAVDAPLDELDPTYGAPYTLNCSSAGLDRPFKTESDYLRHMGEKIEIHLYAAQEGKKTFEGVLVGYGAEGVRMETERGERTFPRDKIAKACLFIDV